MKKPAKIGLKLTEDSGYTRLCPRCGDAHGINPFMRGRERVLDLELCKVCVNKPRIHLVGD